MSDFSHLWNDMPAEDRRRLSPFGIQAHILHLRQARSAVVRGHKRTLADIDSHIKRLEDELARVLKERGAEVDASSTED